MEVEIDDKRSPTDICDDKRIPRNSQHKKEPYSLAKRREKQV